MIAVTDLLQMAQAKFGLLFLEQVSYTSFGMMRKGFPATAKWIYLGTASEAEPLQSLFSKHAVGTSLNFPIKNRWVHRWVL